LAETKSCQKTTYTQNSSLKCLVRYRSTNVKKLAQVIDQRLYLLLVTILVAYCQFSSHDKQNAGFRLTYR